MVRATVIEIRTTTQPDNKTFEHTILIAGNKARTRDELDQWRLFDLEKETVTFVDDVAKTIRTEPVTRLLQQRRTALSKTVSEQTPRAKVEATGTSRPLLGVPATQSVVTVGEYRRELWIGAHPQIPPRLFALMQISDLPSSPLAPMMKSVDEALTNVRGFPLVDRSELPLGNSRMIVEHAVTSVRSRDVPRSLLRAPADYRDLTAAATERGVRRLPVALPLPGRKARGAG